MIVDKQKTESYLDISRASGCPKGATDERFGETDLQVR